jgi:hypothetical protein
MGRPAKNRRKRERLLSECDVLIHPNGSVAFAIRGHRLDDLSLSGDGILTVEKEGERCVLAEVPGLVLDVTRTKGALLIDVESGEIAGRRPMSLKS